MPIFADVCQGYANLWRTVDFEHPGIARVHVLDQIDIVINRGLEHRDLYDAVERRLGVPWWWTLAIHNRESSMNFGTHLHNGDPLSGYTFHVPEDRPQVGHGPPFTWDESADDALRLKGLQDVKSWTIERGLYESERYNGWGYFGRISSPYVWAWTNHYDGGKITVDHGPINKSVYDAQLGCAAVWKRMVDRGLFKPTSEIVVAPQQPSPSLGPLPNQSDRPFRYQGIITLAGVDYLYATGGLNRGSAPYGTWLITPDAIGPIGQRLGAIGIAGGEIEDPKYPGAAREGIEIHPGSSNAQSGLISEGCIVLLPSKYQAFKAALLAEIAKNGPQLIQVGADTHIVIRSQNSPQPQESPVTTTPTTTVALPQFNFPNIDLAAVQHTFQVLEQLGIINALSAIYPPAGVVLKIAETAVTTAASVGSGQSLIAVIPQGLRDLATQIESLAPKTS